MVSRDGPREDTPGAVARGHDLPAPAAMGPREHDPQDRKLRLPGSQRPEPSGHRSDRTGDRPIGQYGVAALVAEPQRRTRRSCRRAPAAHVGRCWPPSRASSTSSTTRRRTWRAGLPQRPRDAVLAAFASQAAPLTAVSRVRPALAASTVLFGGTTSSSQKSTSARSPICAAPSCSRFRSCYCSPSGSFAGSWRRPAAARRRLRDRAQLHGSEARQPLLGPVDLRGEPRHRHGSWASRSTTACSCSRAIERSSPVALTRGQRSTERCRPRAHCPVQLADSRRCTRLAAGLSAALPLLDGDRRHAGHALGRRSLAARAPCGACRARSPHRCALARHRCSATQHGRHSRPRRAPGFGSHEPSCAARARSRC